MQNVYEIIFFFSFYLGSIAGEEHG